MANLFQFDQYRSPYANSIADLILRQGEAPANALIASANARAQAMQQSGQAWGNAIQGAAQALSGLPQQIQQQQIIGQQNQLRAAQIADAEAQADQRAQSVKIQQAVEAQNAYIDHLMATSLKPDPTTGVVTLDRPTFEQALLQSNMGHLYPQLAEHLDKLDASQSKRNKDAREMIATSLMAIGDAGYTHEAALTAAAYLKANRVIGDDQLKPFLAGLAQDNSPANVKALVEHVGQVVPEYQELLKADAKKKAELEKTKADTLRSQAEAAKIQAEVAGTLPQNPANLETERHNRAMEAISQMTARREAAAQQETARHNRATESASNPLAALTGQPQAAGGAPMNVTGEDFIKTLPPNIANEVKAYAEGRRPFPAGFALKSPYFQSLIQMVGQYDPTFDAVNYNARAKTRQDFTSGKAAQTINALNTVTQHLDRLSQSADGLNNSSLPAWNSVANLVSQASGNPSVTKFETDKKAVVDELTRAWRQSGGTAQDIKSWSSVLDASSSPAQLHTAIAEMGKLLEGKMSALQEQFNQGMGTAANLRIITPQAQSVLDRLNAKVVGGAVEWVRDANGRLVKKGG